MPLSVCRCCGGPIEADPLRQSANPNICPSCEQLLEDDSPNLMAEIARLQSQQQPDDLLDEPSRIAPSPSKKLKVPAPQAKESKN